MQQTRVRIGAAALLMAIVGAAPAAAQTAAASETSWFLGGTGGVAVVQNVGAAYGGEIGTTLSPKLDVFGEALGMTDTATRARIGLATSVATVLQSTQGTTATGTVKAPAAVFLGGLRYTVHESGNLKVFIEGAGGMARVSFQPAFTLAGADVTTQLSNYGITLGADLAGTATKAAFGGGVGLEVRHDFWYMGAEVGVLSIRTPSQPSNVIHATAMIGRWF